MEYLISYKELGLIKEQPFNENTFFNTLFDNNSPDTCLDFICPICKNRDTYKDWWCCKGCGNLPLEEFNKELIKHFNV